MKHRFLFRLDGSKENDEFFLCRRGQASCVAYSGTAMSVGPGWIPDLIEVDVSEDESSATVTLIELEAVDITARASCRKYLPETSVDVVQRFLAYLDTVKKQCLATADPRGEDFEALRNALLARPKVVVRTAGALRSSPDFLEMHALLDQPERVVFTSLPSAVVAQNLSFTGARPFSREETDGLRRTVRILHAVVAGHDHSSGTVHSWRNLRRKPLDIAVAKDPDQLRELHRLVSNKSASGMRLDCDRLAEELVVLWSMAGTNSMTRTDVAGVIQRFAPLAMAFSNQESMRTVYDSARVALKSVAI
jgi:hypothetical protein